MSLIKGGVGGGGMKRKFIVSEQIHLDTGWGVGGMLIISEQVHLDAGWGGGYHELISLANTALAR